MANIWVGADPGNNDDFPQTYELGSVVEFLAAGTLDSLRVYSPGAHSKAARRGHVWAMNGALLDTVTLTDVLPAGWSTHSLASPRTVAKGEFYVISYETAGDYGATGSAFASTVLSADGNAAFPQSTAVGGMGGTNGNGRFHTSHATFPNQSSGAFYGVDAVYTVSGGVAPVIGTASVVGSGLTATLSVTATDADTLVGATYVIDWGDGQTSNGSIAAGSVVVQHTYADPGVKAILVTVTDASALSDYAAVAVELLASGAGLNATSIRNALISHAAATGLFDTVAGHESKRAPGNGLVAEVFLGKDAIQPVRQRSGLAATSARIEFTVRIRTNMLAEPQDDIDLTVTAAADALFSAYAGDFRLGGAASDMDLQGAYGPMLRASGGYIAQDNRLYRVVDIFVPVLRDDAWVQAP